MRLSGEKIVKNSRVFMCKSCFSLRERKKRGKCHLCKSDTFVVDEWIALTIVQLNKKGYSTRYCCSGHPMQEQKCSNEIDTYITFKYNESIGTYVMFKCDIDKFNGINPPVGFQFEKNIIGRLILRWVKSEDNSVVYSDFKNYGEMVVSWANALKNLNHWAEGLP